MLDVHAPHEKIHGYKDFFLHLFTITVGLLIALGLEGCVEWQHHRHLRREAESNLLQEVRDNEKELRSAHEATKGELQNLTGVLRFLQAKEAGKPYDLNKLQLQMALSGLSDASWRTASATGALSLMEYGTVQRFASAYQLQEQLGRLQTTTLDDFLGLESYVVNGTDPTAMSPEQARVAEREVRQVMAHLVAMSQVSDNLEKEYDRALAGK